MTQTIYMTTIQPDAANAVRASNAVEHLGVRRPFGPATVFARRRAS